MNSSGKNTSLDSDNKLLKEAIGFEIAFIHVIAYFLAYSMSCHLFNILFVEKGLRNRYLYKNEGDWMKMFEFTGLRTLHKGMMKKGEERATFPFEFNGKYNKVLPYEINEV